MVGLIKNSVILTISFTFQDFIWQHYTDDVLYNAEIIGVLHEVVKTQTLASGKKPCTNLILADEWYYATLAYCVSI
jgi:hypothetical protein